MKASFNISCDAALELISPFMDSMTSIEETESLRSHLDECALCRRELQSLASLRTIMASVEPLAVPEDLQLETRIRLSHARSSNVREWWKSRVDNVLRPFAMPAVMGVILTFLGFGILFGSFTTHRAAASESGRDVVVIYQQPTTTVNTLQRFKAAPATELDQVISMQTEVNDAGRIYEYKVIGGTRNAHVDQFLQEVVLLSQFKPATTYWGLPVNSRVILSFVTVRG